MTPYTQSTLTNGLRVLTMVMPHAYSITAALYFGVGSRYESDADAGVAHLIEHVLFKGTTRRPTSRDIVLSIEGVGGVLNAGTGREATNVWAQAAHIHLERVLETLFDVARNSLFRTKDVAKEQQIIVEEINEALDIPGEVAAMVGYELLYPGHPLGRDIAGTRESVTALTVDRVVAFANDYYRPSNAVLTVAGAVTHDDVIALADRYAGDWAASPPASPRFEPAPSLPPGPHVQVDRRPIEQVHVFLAARGLSRHHEDRYTLSLLNAILGDGMASRLFLRVREDLGLAYSIGSGVSLYDDTGDVYVEASVDSKNVPAALTAIREEMDRICTEPIAPAELDSVREYVKGCLLLSLESTYANASWYGTQALLKDEIVTPEQALARLDAVTAADVQRVARTLFGRHGLTLSLVGPVDVDEMWERFLL